jgi:hypothetical protein
MTSDDVKHLLQSMADHGASRVKLDEHALVPRIRRRRFRRTATIGVASIATAAVIAVTASAVLPGRGNDAPIADSRTPTATTQPIPTSFPPVPFECGTMFPAPSTIGSSNLVIKPKTMTRTADGWTGTLDYTVTNDDKDGATWVNAWGNDELIVVLRNKLVAKGTMTANKKTTDLRPGKTLTFHVRIDIRSCGPVAYLPADSYLFYSDIKVQGKLRAGTVVEEEPFAEFKLN